VQQMNVDENQLIPDVVPFDHEVAAFFASSCYYVQCMHIQ
jgi:hypothetical protein